MSITKILQKENKNDMAPINYPIYLTIKGRGKNSTPKYHNLMTGEDCESLEEIAAKGNAFVVLKESGSDTILTFGENKLYIYRTTQSNWEFVSYDITEHNGEKFFTIYVMSLDIRTTLSSPDEKRKPILEAKCYIDKNKKLYFSRQFAWGGTEEYFPRDAKGLYPRYNWQDMQNINCFDTDRYYGDEERASKLAEMGWEVVTLGNNRRIVLNAGWEIVEFLKYKEPVKKSGPKQRKIDELTTYELEDVVVPELKEISDNIKSWELKYKLEELYFANISKVEGYDKPICCYRTFARTKSGRYSEGARIYIEENGVFTACKKTNLGDWVNVSLSGDNSNFGYKISYINKDAIKGTVLEYLIPMLNGKRGKHAGSLIAAALRHPCIEKLYKSGFEELIISAAKSSYCNLWESLTNNLGELNEKGKTVNAIIGVSKIQLKAIEEEMEYFKNIKLDYNFDKGVNACIRILKKCFNTSSLNNIDINTFKDMLHMISEAYKYKIDCVKNGIVDSKGEVHKQSSWYISRDTDELWKCMNIIYANYPTATARSMILKLEWLFKQHIETVQNRYDWSIKGYRDVIEITRPINTYCSFLEMLNKLPERNGISCHFQNIEHIKILHDDILPVYNYYSQLERARMSQWRHQEILEKWEKCKKSWAEWEFTDGEYSVIMPDEPYKLTVEGTSLGHCVGGYIDKVVKRTTNIMFIRKAEAIDKPFFTVEILTDGTIEQIHGMRNCNIADPDVKKEEPNLVAFVDKWVLEKKLCLHNINKVR